MTAWPPGEALERFRRDYGAHRAAEGRGYRGADLLALPYLRRGPFAGQWAVRARTYEAFMARVAHPLRRELKRPLAVLDLGAGNGWLSRRLAVEGDRCTAVDIRDDAVDGLGATAGFGPVPPFKTLLASFDSLPLASAQADLVVFNASLHYATDLKATLAEARRVARPGGCLVVLDSPFYAREADGQAMVAEKHATAQARFGDRSDSLLALPFIEFLTAERLAVASPALDWRRMRVLYPLRYELRPLAARLKGQRLPSRFDLWTAEAA